MMAAVDVLTSLPDSFAAGTTVKYTVTFADFPASGGWTLKVYLAGPSVITPVSGSASGASFNVTIASTETAKMTAGTYQYREVVTKAGETYIAGSGLTVVGKDISQAAGGDMQSWDERMIPLLEDACEALMKNPTKSYSIGGRAFTKTDLATLLRILDSLRAKVAAAKRPGQFGVMIRDRVSRPA